MNLNPHMYQRKKERNWRVTKKKTSFISFSGGSSFFITLCSLLVSLLQLPLPGVRTKTMGSCVSKCCSSSPHSEIDVASAVQEKLVICETPAATATAAGGGGGGVQLSCDLSDTQNSSSSISSSTASSSSSSSCTTSSTYPSSYCSKQNPRIVLLDPNKRVAVKSQTVRRPTPRPVRAKRDRSSSPNSTPCRKSIRSESSSPVALSSRKVNMQQQRHQIGIANHQITTRKENMRSARVACYSTSPSLEKEPNVLRVHNTQEQHSCRVPLTEDLNNPLISMDCFIFL